MQRDSSGLLESIAAGLFCIVALTAIYRRDNDAPVCRTGHVAMAPRPAAVPVQPLDPGTKAEITDMFLHD